MIEQDRPKGVKISKNVFFITLYFIYNVIFDKKILNFSFLMISREILSDNSWKNIFYPEWPNGLDNMTVFWLRSLFIKRF